MATGMRYAQARRDQERLALNDLEAQIPQAFLDAVPDGDPNGPKFTRTSKLAKAALAYVMDLVNTINNYLNNPPATTGQVDPNAPLEPTTPPRLKNNEKYQRLKQAMDRVKHNVQGRAGEGEDISDETEKLMDEANDALVDIIHKFEGDRAEDA